MNEKVKKLWIDALTSGKYIQGRGCLHREDKFCCLGVLCDLYKKKTKKGNWVDNDGIGYFKAGYATSESSLPDPVQKWAGVYEASPELGKSTCISANDKEKKSFKQIAKLIKRYL